MLLEPGTAKAAVKICWFCRLSLELKNNLKRQGENFR